MDNIWLKELRKRRQRQEQELIEPDLVEDAGFERRIEARIFVSKIRRLCAQIDDEAFSLITKIYVYDYKYKELSEEMDIPIGTLLSRVARIKEKLNEKLREPPRRAE